MIAFVNSFAHDNSALLNGTHTHSDSPPHVKSNSHSATSCATIMLPGSTMRAAARPGIRVGHRVARHALHRRLCRALSPRRKRNLVAVVFSELSFFALAWRHSLSLNLMSLMLRVAGPSVDQASANRHTVTLHNDTPGAATHVSPSPRPAFQRAAAPPWHPRQRFRTPLLLP